MKSSRSALTVGTNAVRMYDSQHTPSLLLHPAGNQTTTAPLYRPSRSPPTENRVNHNNSGVLYLSGFRIVQDATLTRHAEYRLVVAGHGHWYRFSELKALAYHPMSEATRQAWVAVRACKPPPGGRTLCSKYLSHKCMALEKFLCLLLKDLPLHTTAHPTGSKHQQQLRVQQLLRRLRRKSNVARERGALFAPTSKRLTGSADSQLKMR